MTPLKKRTRQRCGCSVHSMIKQDLMLMLKLLKAWRVFTQSTDTTSRSCQFFLKESHLGQNRARCCLQQLRDLNPRVRVSAHTGPLDDDLLLQFQVGSGLSRVLHIPEKCPVVLVGVDLSSVSRWWSSLTPRWTIRSVSAISVTHTESSLS